MKESALYGRVQDALAAFLDRDGADDPDWLGKKIVIYGAGGFGRDLAQSLLRKKCNVVGFLDAKGVGQKVTAELKAYSPISDQARSWLLEQPVALIGTHNAAVSVPEIVQLLKELGFARVITPMEFYPHLRDSLGWRYWLGMPMDYAHAAKPIEDASGIWADSQSERLFMETLLFRVGCDLNASRDISGVSCQYADPTVPRWKEPLQMIDGGAYTGDTLEILLRHGYRIRTVDAFEPDLDNFRKLGENVRVHFPDTECSLWPCGISSKTARLNFSEGGGTSSRFSEAGGATVPVVALDDIFHGQSINLIKLDIEGAELDALQGASKLIQKYRPGLAICLYHYPQHVWSIPLWVAGLNLGYRFFYRTHGHNTFETVLYALPEPVAGKKFHSAV